MSFRTLQVNQRARVHVYDVRAKTDTVIHENRDILLEAPNWSKDGSQLLLNGNGRLWSLHPGGVSPIEIPYPGLPDLNNDHVLAPDGLSIFLSANDGHIYHAPLRGGTFRRVTHDDGAWHFLHGVSPDGANLAYVRMTSFDHPAQLAVMPSSGGDTKVLPTGLGHIDGPEWSPDGNWIYMNSENWAEQPGHAQIARIRDDGSGLERLVQSKTVDWFPHVSPDGRNVVYLEYPAGTQGHPADRDVTLVVVDVSDWSVPLARIPLAGGQGTINVNSWSPDSTRFSYVSYPIDPA